MANRLKCRGVEVAVIERDASKVEALRWRGYATFLGDFGSPEVLRSAGIESAGVVIITVRDLKRLRRGFPTVPVKIILIDVERQ